MTPQSLIGITHFFWILLPTSMNMTRIETQVKIAETLQNTIQPAEPAYGSEQWH
jgi:hypothetical protein